LKKDKTINLWGSNMKKDKNNQLRVGAGFGLLEVVWQGRRLELASMHHN